MLAARRPQTQQSSTRTLLSASRDFVESIWIFVSRGGLVLLVALLLFCVRPLVFDHTYVIGEFSVPEEIRATGITSGVIGRRLYGRISEIQRIGKAAVAEQQHDAQVFASFETAVKIGDIKFLGAEINFGTLVSTVRALFGLKNNRIIGELVIEPTKGGPIIALMQAQTYRLEVHAVGDHPWSKRTETSSVIDELIEVIAAHIVEKIDPLSAGFYYFVQSHNNQANLNKAIALTDKFQNKEDANYIWALVLRGMAWQAKQDSSAAGAALCQAIAHDKSFTPAWRLLGAYLKQDKALAQAQDVALRLIRKPQTDAEGFRQLGNLRSTQCAADEETKQKTREYYRYAMTLGATQRSKSHYLTLVDYSKWLYENAEAGKLYERLETELPLPANIDYLQTAAEYLTRAQVLAPEQQSVYTNFARVLGYPRLTKPEPASAWAGRHALAETKARFALELSDHPFAHFALGELLTDQGVENHRYKKDCKKFDDAEKHLKISKDTAPWREILYEGMYARALAGQGKFPQAQKVLEGLSDRKSMLLQWVYGEMLYNESFSVKQNLPNSCDQALQAGQNGNGLSTQNDSIPDRALLQDALAHLNLALSYRSCGPRADVVKNLKKLIEVKLQGDRQASTDSVHEGKSVAVPAALPLVRDPAGERSPPESLQLNKQPPAPGGHVASASGSAEIISPVCPQWETLLPAEPVPLPVEASNGIFSAVVYP
jgi:hypothetical protein